MKIIHIQTGMSPAGNAAYRLHSAMIRCGVESKVLTYLQTLPKEGVESIKQTPDMIIKKYVNAIQSGRIRSYIKENEYQYSTYPPLGVGIENNRYIRDADVIYLHWVAGNFLSLNDIENLAKTNKPIVFFMHDMFTFTGGCHHSFNCEQYKIGCTDCPMFNKKSFIAHRENQKKEQFVSKYNNLYFISPSNWMASCAKKSNILANKPVLVIPNVVDENIFKPLDKIYARKILNIPLDKYIITFGCQSGTKNKFKGWNYLRDAINEIVGDNILCLIYGSNYNQSTVEELKHPVRFLGPIYEEVVLSLICNSSDLFVSPSLAESFGLTFLENIMCGTPVIGFNCTAIPEIVKHKINGYLADYKSAKDLQRGIEAIYKNNICITQNTTRTSSEIVCMHIDLINSIKNK